MNYRDTVLGLELGSTRIKAVLLDRSHQIVASGSFEWENQLVNGIWTYDLQTVHQGVQACYAALRKDAESRFGAPLTTVGAIGISAMMHGYLPFDREGKLLTAFRTWRNTMTAEAAEKLSALFRFNIPQRWSIAHLYQALLNGEAHTQDIAYLTTLSGYVHQKLTGERVLGIGDASGMMPIDSETLDYDAEMLRKFDAVSGLPSLRALFPKVLPAGAVAGYLTEEGARFLDPGGTLQPGIPFAPPEGDAGTGMVATNSVRVHTGNVSAGTSDFAMVVVDRRPAQHEEIDMIATPDGLPVAMVHGSNCTSDINAWVKLFEEFAEYFGLSLDKGTLFTRLFQKALEGDADCGGLLSYNYLSGEHITHLSEGRPLFVRTPDAEFTLANFMRTHLYSAISTLKIGFDVLLSENVRIDRLTGHGGFFKTPVVGQTVLSAAVGVPVSVMETAGEGGPFGMALLAAYTLWGNGLPLADYLDEKVFADASVTTLTASEKDIAGFNAFHRQFVAALPAEKAAVDTLRRG